ncbi:MAG: transglutaminase-like domain-containing protein, partial [Clostridia bacterium]|nr:transglutaminase-like domain-containing protein [Clostridia bacterium]
MSKKFYKNFNIEDYYKYVESMALSDMALSCDNDYKDVYVDCKADFYAGNYIPDRRLERKFKVKSIAGEGDSMQRALRVMQWLTDNSYYNGCQYKGISDNTYKILKYALNNDFSHAINCRFKAIALTDLLLSIDIPALPIGMLGFCNDKKTGAGVVNCHFVVHVYIKEQGRWIVVDPSFNASFYYEGKPLDIFELKTLICQNKDYEIRGYNFNKDSSRCIDIYKKYFIENTLEFICTWVGSGVKRKRWGIGNIFNCILSPDKDNFSKKCISYIGKSSNKT